MVRLSLAALAVLFGLTVSAAEGPKERTTNDRQIIDLMARVHDQGATLFNAGDHGGCYRMFQGALVTVKLVLPKELQENIDRGLAQAELEGNGTRRALMLHELIEDVRKKLHPTAGKAETLPTPRKVVTENEPIRVPGVPTPPDPVRTEGPKLSDSSKPMELEIPKLPGPQSPEPPRAPTTPGRIALEPPPPIITGVPTATPKPMKPTPPPPPPPPPMDMPPPEPLAVPPRPTTPMPPAPMTPAPPSGPDLIAPPLPPPAKEPPAKEPPPLTVPPIPK